MADNVVAVRWLLDPQRFVPVGPMSVHKETERHRKRDTERDTARQRDRE